MMTPPTYALAVSDAIRYFNLKSWQPRHVLHDKPEPLRNRVERLRTAWSRSRAADAERVAEHNCQLFKEAMRRSRKRVPSPEMLGVLLEMGLDLALQNDNVYDFPEVDFSRSLTSGESVDLTGRLVEIQTRIEHDERIHSLFSDGLRSLYANILDELPDAAFNAGAASFTVPLHALINPAELISRLMVMFIQQLLPNSPDAVAALSFSETRHKIWQNLLDVSQLTPEQFEKAPHKIIAPPESRLAPERMVDAYLGGTPLASLFNISLPFSIPASARSEHVLMIARTGGGKSQYIQRDILDNLMATDSPGMVVIDSQNQMIPKLERLAVARDRIVIIDPFDPEPPALNMFMPPRRQASAHQQEINEAKTLEQFAWIFSALDQELTGRQNTLFTFCARILLSMRSNMQTLLDLLRIEKWAELRSSPFWPYIERSDPQTLYFFEHRFCTSDYNKTKFGVADRLLGVLRIPAFNRMFMAPANKLDLYAELEQRKLVVFNTHKNALGNDASAILGRYAISLYVRAAFERERDRAPPPAFLYVDEASEYFGKKDSSDVLFTQLRKYNCGTFVAFQDLSQLAEQKHTLVANTVTKLTGALTHTDAGHLAPNMRCSEEELMSIRKHPDSFEFMCYVDNVTTRAVKLSFGYGAVEYAPQLSTEEHLALRQRNRERLSIAADHSQERESPAPDVDAARRADPASVAESEAVPSPPDWDVHPGKDWSETPT